MMRLAVPALEVNEYIDRFEAAQRRGNHRDLEDFLPAREHPLHGAVLQELVRVDLELGWDRGQPPDLNIYGRRFPSLFANPDAMAEIAFEDYRQRLLAGHRPSRLDYQQQYGVDSGDWPTALSNAEDRSVSRKSSTPADQRCAPWRPSLDAQTSYAASYSVGSRMGLDAAELYKEVQRSDPHAVYRLAHVLAAMPEVGRDFLGFRLVTELGRGAFGRVFLAQQSELADRLVALKVSSDLFGESQKLAQLQHTNIVPIYSVHQEGPFQAVCMPYFGATTLAAIFKGLQEHKALPDSGKHFVTTLRNRKSTRREDEPSRPTPPAQPKPPPLLEPSHAEAIAPQTNQTTSALETLEGLSYVHAVVWIGARLADGLAHAHERGILHRDLKPANVLLTDDGQPMLLDFNLSEDVKLRSTVAAAGMGGTLPYMSPEQLEVFQGNKQRTIDARSDLYSLGVLLYELLTGRHPFETPNGASSEILPHLLEQHRRPPPCIRTCNQAVSAAVEAIVGRCLQPKPEDRYQSARELREDLDRHLADLPLRHTPEPSRRERWQKWARRHPRLTSAATVATTAAVLLIAVGSVTADLWRQQRLGQADALFQQFREDKASAELVLNVREPDQIQLEEGLEKGRHALDRYRVLDNERWLDLPIVRNLAAKDQSRLREEVADLLWSLARATALQADRRNDAGPQSKQLVWASELNRRAESSLGSDKQSKAIFWQRAELAERRGQKSEAKEWFDKAEHSAAQTARDQFQIAVKLSDRGQTLQAQARLNKAVAELEEFTGKNPRDFWAWYLLGDCQELLKHYPEAITCYTVCTALNPKSYESYFKRGLLYARQRRWRAARADFDRAIAQRPERSETYFQRGLTLKEQKEFAAAERDFTQALELGTDATRVYFQRAVVREKQGDLTGAKLDRDEGMRREPRDEVGWVDRGLARMQRDPKGALADFEQALRINSRFYPALQDKAHVLSEILHKNEESLAVINQLVTMYPDFVPARLNRGVLLARLGKRDAAISDARAALTRDSTPPTFYQAANIFALTSRQNPDDKRDAFPLLSRALLGGFGLDVINQDKDMDPIRNDPEFRRIVEAARGLRDSARQAAAALQRE